MSSSLSGGEEGCGNNGSMQRPRCCTRRKLDRVWKLSWHLPRGIRRRSTPETHRGPPQRPLEREGILPEELCGFRPLSSTVDMMLVMEKEGSPAVHVLYLPPQSLRIRRPDFPADCPSSLWRATEHSRRQPPIPRRLVIMHAAR